MQSPGDQERDLDLAALGDGLSAMRLCDASALETVRRSLARHGQLDPLSVFGVAGQFEILDGFKRVRAARALGWRTLRGRVAEVDRTEAKIQLVARHDRRGLTELEEAWLIRSLHRDDGLSQPAIAVRLGRHRSWVFRRLMLVESLDPAVQADVRLGLLMPRAATAVGQLPRGNQHALSAVVIRRGLTVRQTELLVAELLDLPDDAARAQQLARRLDGAAPGPSSGLGRSRRTKSEIDWMAGDLRTLRLVAARLEARLAGGALTAIGVDAAVLAKESLVALVPVLDALRQTLTLLGESRTAFSERMQHDGHLAHP